MAVAAKLYGLSVKEALLLTPSTFAAMLALSRPPAAEKISEEV